MIRPRLILRKCFRLGFPLCGWLSLGLFVFAVSGLPIPLPFAKDLSRPFPCMFSQCGCRDAEQCWRSCCCHTAAARLAWARAHHVRPPDGLVAAAKAEANRRDRPRETRSCCADHGSRTELSFLAALKCRGVHDVVAGVPICLPPAHADWQPILLCIGHIRAAQKPTACWVESPPVPPPRSADC